MLRRRKKQEKKVSEPFTYIHHGTVIEGDLVAEGRVRVHGTIRGNIQVDGVLEVAEAGVIEGDRIEAHEVKIIGRVQANVTARGKIEIWQKGQLVGDVRASALDIEEGASFTGRSEMNPSRTAGSLPEPSVAAAEVPAEPEAPVASDDEIAPADPERALG